MALIIKGDMPNTCFECLTDLNRDVFCDGLCALLTPEEAKRTRHPDCPIIGEIPDEHGRLVSADEVQNKMSYYGFHAVDMTIHEFIDDELATIVEASR